MVDLQEHLGVTTTRRTDETSLVKITDQDFVLHPANRSRRVSIDKTDSLERDSVLIRPEKRYIRKRQ